LVEIIVTFKANISCLADAQIQPPSDAASTNGTTSRVFYIGGVTDFGGISSINSYFCEALLGGNNAQLLSARSHRCFRCSSAVKLTENHEKLALFSEHLERLSAIGTRPARRSEDAVGSSDESHKTATRCSATMFVQ
jgi:hypothetical protein